MAANFLSNKDQELDAWALNFSTQISLTPTAYGTTAAEATAFAALRADFTARLEAATNPLTRTKVTLEQKEISKAALKAKARSIARVINAFPAITNAQRAELGLTVRDSEPSPRPAPVTQPVVSIEGTGGGQAQLRLVDQTTPLKAAKPAGVFGAIVYTKIGTASDTPPQNPAEAQFSGVATRSLHRMPLPPNSAGKTLWVLAQWMNVRGEPGPVSVVTSSLIAA